MRRCPPRSYVHSWRNSQSDRINTTSRNISWLSRTDRSSFSVMRIIRTTYTNIKGRSLIFSGSTSSNTGPSICLVLSRLASVHRNHTSVRVSSRVGILEGSDIPGSRDFSWIVSFIILLRWYFIFSVMFLIGKGANFASRFFRLFLRIFFLFSVLFREFVLFDELWDREVHREYVMIDGSGVFDFRLFGPLLHDLEI